MAARSIKPVPPEVILQISNQARHDPTLFAAGAAGTGNLGQRESFSRIDVAGLLRVIPRSPEFLLIVPRLTGAEQPYVTDLLTALKNATVDSIQTIVTEQESSAGFDGSAIENGLRAENILFWPDFCIGNPGLTKFAQLMLLLRPRMILVANSLDGYEIVARFGHALSKQTKMYCLYKDSGEHADLTAYFVRRTLAFATALIDDSTLAASLGAQYCGLLHHDVILVPRHSSSAAWVDAIAAHFKQP
jgi:hypothetical protein